MLYIKFKYSLSPRLAHQVLWSRLLNPRGIPGHNIACDLNMEHLNRLVNNAWRWQRGKEQKGAFTRMGKAVETVYLFLKQFDSSHGVVSSSGSHGRQVSLKRFDIRCEGADRIARICS